MYLQHFKGTLNALHTILATNPKKESDEETLRLATISLICMNEKATLPVIFAMLYRYLKDIEPLSAAFPEHWRLMHDYIAVYEAELAAYTTICPVKTNG